MRRFVAASLGLLVLFVVGAVIASVVPLAAVHAAPSMGVALQAREESPCIAEPLKQANPDVLLLGEQTQLTLRVKAICAGEIYPLHIVLVLDQSGSMCDNNKIDSMKKAAQQLVRNLNMDQYPNTKVGIVSFNEQAFKRCDLTNQENRAVGAIGKIQCGGGTAIDLGMAEGLKMMLKGRRDVPANSTINEVMVVLSDGGNNAGCDPVLQEANKVKSNGILLVTICVGSDCDAACMRQAASSPRYFFQVEDASGLLQVFDRIRKEVQNIVLKNLKVRDTLPDNMRYVPDSAVPAPKNISANGDVLEWETNFVPSEGMTYTFNVEPLETGYWPTNLEAKIEFTDNKGRGGEKFFSVPYVTVLQPDPLPTRTLPPPPPTFTPTPTPTNTPTVGPTPTNTPTPTPTPTPRPKPIYLPILIWHPCEPPNWYSDIALVLDISTSMRRPTSAGRSKLAATIDGAKAFIDTLQHLQPDKFGKYEQVAVVGFNAKAWIEQPLTNDPNLAKAALDRLPADMVEYTRLDLAVRYGAFATGGVNHRPDNQKVIILLTDGLPNQVPYAEDGTMETTILNEATVAKADHNKVYTIAIGKPADTNPTLLKGIATDPSMYYYMPDPEHINDIYSQIYGSLGCPTSRYQWNGMPWPEP